MNTPSEHTEDWDDLRNKIIGLGEHSSRKSYYPELQRRIEDLERLRVELDQRLIALTQPVGDSSTIRFNDLFAIDEIQAIQDAFSEATGVASIITDVDGVPITQPSNFSRLCTLIRATPKGLERCMYSDRELGRLEDGNAHIGQCLSAGFWDAGTSIVIGDRVVAKWLIGQVVTDDLDEESVLAYIREIGGDETAARAALPLLVRMSHDQFKKVHHALTLTARQLSLLALQNVQQARAITERQRVEQALADSEHNFRMVFNSTHDAILIHDMEGRIIEVNSSMETMYGVSRTDALRMTVKDISWPAPDTDSKLLEFWGDLRDGTDKVFEWKAMRYPDALAFDVEVFLRPMQWSGRDCILAVIRDVSVRKLLEAQLISAQKLDGLGTLAGGIAHDFNNLLMMVMTSAEMMKNGVADNPKLMKQVDRIITASQRGSSITKQLLLFSRQEQLEMEDVSLSVVVSELLEILDHFLPKTISIRTAIGIDNDTIIGNAGHLQQAMLNLAINAKDAMHGGGTLTVGLSTVSGEEVQKRFPEAERAAYVAISISDTGTGIGPETITKIYDPFFTTKERGKGTGLGLSIVHSIVKAHKGFLDLQTTVGLGTTFTMLFPLAAARRAESVPEASLHTSNTATILIVEDEEVLRELLTEHLSYLGYTVITASGGEEALTVFTEHRAEIHLLVTDLGMPGMSGQQLVQKIRTLSGTLPIVISSGYLEYRSADELKKMGATAVITKPYRLKEIDAVVRSALSGRSIG